MIISIITHRLIWFLLIIRISCQKSLDRQIKKQNYHQLYNSELIIKIKMFLLKEQKQNQPTTFDETHLDIKINHGRSQLQEIKVVHSWASQAIKVRLPKLNCQWFNKTDSSMELIPGVTEDSYQPSIIDVGTSIYVQVVPESKELQYQGMPITRMTAPIQLASETEEQAKDLLEAGKSTFFIELKELYIKGLNEQQQQPVDGKVPIKQCLLKVIKNKMLLMGRTSLMEKSEVLLSGEIGQQYPQLQIDRTCGKFLNVLFNAEEYAIVILQNNKIRDVLYLLTKTIQERQANEKVQEKSGEKLEEIPVPTNQIILQSITNSSQTLPQQGQSSKKSQQSLPLSPQTIQKQTPQSANIIIISELRNKLAKSESECQRYIRQNVSLKEKLNNMSQENTNLTTNLSATNQKLKKIQQQFTQTKIKSQKQKEQMCYLKNQCRLLEQTNSSLHQQIQILQDKFAKLQRSLKLSEQEKLKFGKHSHLKLQDALCLILNQEKQIDQYRLKHEYLQTKIQSFQDEIATTRHQLQQVQGTNKHLLKKVQSLLEAQSKLKIQVSSYQKEENQTLNFTISKQKQENGILKAEIQALQKQKLSIRMQVKQLIEENTILRSKEKSSKHELKLQIVQLKKLMNRFTEMITEKDLELQNLKLANRTLNKAMLQNKK